MTTYNLRSIPFPILSGRSLQLFAAALDNPATRAVLLPRLLKDGGINYLRDLRPADPTTNHPIHLPDEPFATAAPDLREITHAASQRMQTVRLPLRSVRDFARAYTAGEADPVAVAERAIAAIAASDAGQRPLRAFIASQPDDIRRQAEAAADRIQRGQPLSIFDGVPVVIKDEIDMLPYPTTVGTRFLGRKRPVTADATVVARLRAAGALLLGKANMHEIGIYPNSINPIHGIGRNPYHLDHECGGSSSGSAAAVAAGIAPVALGADGGGSIRIPAAYCGLVGLKATFGRISEVGAAPLDWSIAHIGPIGVNVEDVALTYAAIAGPDPGDQWTRYQPEISVTEWLFTRLDDELIRPLTLGIYRPWFDHADPQIVAACTALLDKLAEQGAQIHEIEIPELEEMRIAHSVSILAEMAASMSHYPDNWGDFAPSTRISLAMGRAFTAADYIQAQRIRTRAIAIFKQIFQEVDAIISPATAVVAPAIPPDSHSHGLSDLSTVLEAMRYVFPGNLTGLPAITFPAGYNSAGLPIGMQAMGRPWQEDTLLRIAHAAEQVVERRPPSLYFDLLEQME